MTMIDPAPRTLVTPTERKRLTPMEKAAILERQDDNCPKCGETLVWCVVDGRRVYGPMIDEHILPLGLAGSNDLANREMWCIPCSRRKTRADLRSIAKAKRLAVAQGPETKKKPKRQIKSPGFNKRLSRGFDGKVRPR